jgi:hypothetical protein
MRTHDQIQTIFFSTVADIHPILEAATIIPYVVPLFSVVLAADRGRRRTICRSATFLLLIANLCLRYALSARIERHKEPELTGSWTSVCSEGGSYKLHHRVQSSRGRHLPGPRGKICFGHLFSPLDSGSEKIPFCGIYVGISIESLPYAHSSGSKVNISRSHFIVGRATITPKAEQPASSDHLERSLTRLTILSLDTVSTLFPVTSNNGSPSIPL